MVATLKLTPELVSDVLTEKPSTGATIYFGMTPNFQTSATKWKIAWVNVTDDTDLGLAKEYITPVLQGLFCGLARMKFFDIIGVT